MDLSGIIFVVLAIGWAVYLLPKALKHHDDLDRSRPVEEFSDKVRVLGRGAAPAAPATSPSAVAAPVATAPAPTLTREAARRAAKRRRRVLGLLLVVAAGLSVSSYLAYTPWWSTAIPGGLIVVFLVVARLSVRAQQARRVAPVRQQHVVTPTASAETEPDLGIEDTQGLSRAELDEALAEDAPEPVLDDGGLWDPLPVTLPTYVTKARARRTIRTIEITAGNGVTSSGHDAADTALAQEAARLEAEQQPVAEDEAEVRRAAGA